MFSSPVHHSTGSPILLEAGVSELAKRIARLLDAVRQWHKKKQIRSSKPACVNSLFSWAPRKMIPITKLGVVESKAIQMRLVKAKQPLASRILKQQVRAVEKKACLVTSTVVIGREVPVSIIRWWRHGCLTGPLFYLLGQLVSQIEKLKIKIVVTMATRMSGQLPNRLLHVRGLFSPSQSPVHANSFGHCGFRSRSRDCSSCPSRQCSFVESWKYHSVDM